jgi:hypothetical protein
MVIVTLFLTENKERATMKSPICFHFQIVCLISHSGAASQIRSECQNKGVAYFDVIRILSHNFLRYVIIYLYVVYNKLSIKNKYF